MSRSPLADVAVPAPGLAQRVDDGGVGLQRHAALAGGSGTPRRCAAARRAAPSPAPRSRPASRPARSVAPARRMRAAARASITSRKRSDHAPRRARPAARGRAACRRCPGRGSPRGPWPRGRGRGSAPGRGRRPGRRRRRCPCRGHDLGHLLEVRALGKVTSRRTTSPRASLSTICVEGQRPVERVLAGLAAGPASPRCEHEQRGRSAGWRTRPERLELAADRARRSRPGGTTSAPAAARSAARTGQRVSYAARRRQHGQQREHGAGRRPAATHVGSARRSGRRLCQPARALGAACGSRGSSWRIRTAATWSTSALRVPAATRRPRSAPARPPRR